MTIKETIEQLKSLRDSIRASMEPDNPTDIFAADVEALDTAIKELSDSAIVKQEEYEALRGKTAH